MWPFTKSQWHLFQCLSVIKGLISHMLRCRFRIEYAMQNIGTGTNEYDCLGKITKLTVNLHENISELLIAYLTKGWIHSA